MSFEKPSSPFADNEFDSKQAPLSPSLLSSAPTLVPTDAGRTLVFHARPTSLRGAFELRDAATGQAVYSGRMPLFKRKTPGIQLHPGPDPAAAPAVAAVRGLWHTSHELGVGDPERPESMSWTRIRTASAWDPRLTFDDHDAVDAGGRPRQLVWERGPYDATADGDAKATAGPVPTMLRYTLVDGATGAALARSTLVDRLSWTRCGSLRFLRDDLGRETELRIVLSWLVAVVWVCAVPAVLQAETAAAAWAAHQERRAGRKGVVGGAGKAGAGDGAVPGKGVVP